MIYAWHVAVALWLVAVTCWIVVLTWWHVQVLKALSMPQERDS